MTVGKWDQISGCSRPQAAGITAALALSLLACARPGYSGFSAQDSADRAREDRILGQLLNQPRSFSSIPSAPPRAENHDVTSRRRTQSSESGRAGSDAGIEPRTRPPSIKPEMKGQPGKYDIPANIRGFWDDRAKHGRLWTRFTITALKNHGRSLYLSKAPSDITDYCPRYRSLDENGRIDFWVKLISAIAAAESSYNPRDWYPEDMRDENGNAVISRGLLQISMASSRGYGCGMNSSEDLYDPQRNLECGVKILNRWIPRDGVVATRRNTLWLGAARYWSTLRPYNRSSAKIRALMRKSENCRN